MNRRLVAYRRHTLWLAIVATALAPVGCSTIGGKRPIAELAAPLSSGPLGGDFGRGLDAGARGLAVRTEYRALESGLAGSPVNWKTSDVLYGSVTPQQAFSVGSTNCRRYTHVIFQGGASRSAAATACRDEDGVWRPLS